ncbi:MAG: DUF3568 family protein [Gemmatimonadota bacterium]
MSRMLVATVAFVVSLPSITACGKKETAAVGAGAAAVAAIVYNDRGANSKVDASVSRTAAAAENAFRALGIRLTERKTESDGIELKGEQDEWKFVVDIERDSGDTLTSVEVTASKDQINYSKDRAEQVLRAILQRT